MIQVFSQTHERLCLLGGYTSLKITEKLKNGDKSLSFQYPRTGKQAQHLQCENYIRTQDDEFVLKEIGGGKTFRKYTAQLNLEELEGKSFASFETVEKTIAQCLTTAFDGTGWSVGRCEVTKKRTIRKDSVCTAIDIIEQCISTYKCEIEYHTLTKKIDIYVQRGSDKGAYFMEKLNLKKTPSFTASTTSFYTQIRPIGKDGLRISVDGKDYIEDHTYSPKNIMLTWKDERYTIPESLIEDARLKLAELAVPTVTYEADILDLAANSEVYKEILQYGIGDVITLVSITEGIKTKMRITVINRYPESEKENTCQMSTAKKTFADVQQETKDEAVAEATGTASANTTEAVDKESGITSDEIALEVQAMKEEIMAISDETYLQIDDAEKVAEAASKATTDTLKKYVDDQVEGLVTAKKEEDDIAAAKKDVLQTVGNTYATKQQLSDQGRAATQRMDTMEQTRNDMTDADGSIWRMGVDHGRLFIEKIEAEG